MRVKLPKLLSYIVKEVELFEIQHLDLKENVMSVQAPLPRLYLASE